MTDLAALQPVLDTFIPLCRTFGRGRWAITIGGSFGKGTHDSTSDLDLRYYCDELAMPLGAIEAAIRGPVAHYAAQGITIDGVWVRTIAEVEAPLAEWLEGRAKPVELLWSVWGYHLLPDLYYQRIILDPDGVAAGWKARLAVYPPALKRALLARHSEPLRYWRGDYHYASKVRRGDAVFLAGLSARLVHDMCQVLYALNERYFVGDGQNLHFIGEMEIKPPDFAARVEQALYPGAAPASYLEQYQALCGLIDEVLDLVSSDKY